MLDVTWSLITWSLITEAKLAPNHQCWLYSFLTMTLCCNLCIRFVLCTSPKKKPFANGSLWTSLLCSGFDEPCFFFFRTCTFIGPKKGFDFDFVLIVSINKIGLSRQNSSQLSLEYTRDSAPKSYNPPSASTHTTWWNNFISNSTNKKLFILSIITALNPIQIWFLKSMTCGIEEVVFHSWVHSHEVTI